MAIDFPSNPTNGQVYGNWIYDSSITAWRNVNTDTGIGTLNAMGLKNVVPTSLTVASGSATVNANGTITLSGVSSISINNTFASNKDYLLVFTGLIASGGSDFAYRWRSGTSDITASYYGGTVANVYTSSTVTVYGQANNTALAYVGPNGNAISTVRMELSPRPSSSNVTVRSHSAWHGYHNVGGYNTNGLASAPDGITFFTAASTMSGTLQLYVYNN